MKIPLSVRTKTTRTVEVGEITNRQLREVLGLPLTGEITIGDFTLSDDELGEVFEVRRDTSVVDKDMTQSKAARR